MPGKWEPLMWYRTREEAVAAVKRAKAEEPNEIFAVKKGLLFGKGGYWTFHKTSDNTGYPLSDYAPGKY